MVSGLCEASDTFAARLFAGWLKSRLRWTSAVRIEIRPLKHSKSDAIGPLIVDEFTSRAGKLWIRIRIRGHQRQPSSAAAQMGALELHVWGSHVKTLEKLVGAPIKIVSVGADRNATILR